jgi:hypothetical protein
VEEFPGNAHKAKPYNAKVTPAKKDAEVSEDKKVEKIVSGKVVRRKKPITKRFLETFIGGDDAKSVLAYVVIDVLVPAAKDMIADAVNQGFQRMLFGEGATTTRRHGGRPSGPAGYQSYNRFSPGSRPPREEHRDISRRGRARHEFDEIILATRAEAEETIDRMFDLIARYEIATVADLYGLVDISGSYTDEKWGWTDMRGSRATRVSGGYLLDLPKPEPID